MPRPLILLTAFESFLNRKQNASERLVFLANLRQVEDSLEVAIERRVLPVSWNRTIDVFNEYTTRMQPRWVLSFGESPTKCLQLETVAQNWDASLSLDNDGEFRAGQKILGEFPDRLGLSWPAHQVMSELKKEGLDASVSTHAGNFLCNHLCFLHAREQQKSDPAYRGIFIHVPIDYDIRGADPLQFSNQATTIISSVIRVLIN